MQYTEQILDAMIAVAQAHTWTVTEPAKYTVGPIPVGSIVWPVFSALAAEGEEDLEDLAHHVGNDRIEWTYANIVKIKDPSLTYRQLIAAAKEIRALINAETDWGVAGVEDTYLGGWSTRYIPRPDTQDWIQEITLTMEVRWHA